MLLYNQVTQLFGTLIHAIVIAAFNSLTHVTVLFLQYVVKSESYVFTDVYRDCADQKNDFNLFLSLYDRHALWAGAFSSWNMKLFDGKYLVTTVHKSVSIIFWYFFAFRFPSAALLVKE